MKNSEKSKNENGNNPINSVELELMKLDIFLLSSVLDQNRQILCSTQQVLDGF